MPESRTRRKRKQPYTPPPKQTSLKKRPPSAPWVGATILGLFGLGIAWLLVYYISNGGIAGQDSLKGWNIFIGFGFIIAAFGLLTQWQ